MSLFGRRSILQLANLMAGAGAVGLVGMIAIGAALIVQIDEVADRWQNFAAEAVTKFDSLGDLKSEVGAGSLVDSVHLFQAHPDQPHRDQLLESLRLARTNLDLYRRSGRATLAEAEALDQIAAALDRIDAAATEDGFQLSDDENMGVQGLLEGVNQSLARLDQEISAQSASVARANRDSLDQLDWVAIGGGGLAALLLAAVTGAVVWQSRRRVVAPIARLVADSRRLAALQLDEAFDWPYHDELGELGRTLDGARRTLRDLLTENEEKTRRLAYQATHDPLTGLANRAKLIEWLGDRMAEGATSSLALLFLDLDGFKMINDSLGHSIGDKMLIAVANRLSALAGSAERVIRLGGDEFVILVDLAGGQTAKASAAKVEHAFASPFAVEGMDLSISTSVGIAIDDGHRVVAEDLLRDADIALYRAKEGGRGRTEIFDIALRETVLLRHRLHHDLDLATGNHEIYVVYQPIIHLADGRVSGFEALLRWRHPDLGPISPTQFIPIAEETGGILKLGRFVLESAARDLAVLEAKSATPLAVNVNFSPRQMWDESHVAEMLARLGSPDCAAIKIEVTESLAMTNPDTAREILQRFNRIGIPLCIDDFGTGYSSLSYLGRFPFKVLKLDKSFIDGMTDDRPEQARLIRGVIKLAHDLELEVVAEGIEQESERAILTEMGCDFGQGYLFAKPLTLNEAMIFLERT
jgi:diguanylate cyclase (GGDEF)-like protein